MQRYSGGLKVPKEMMEELAAQTTSGGGVLDYWLKYPPKSLRHIQVLFAETSASLNRQAQADAITDGRHVWLHVYKLLSPGAGAECTTTTANTELQGELVINYEVG